MLKAVDLNEKSASEWWKHKITKSKKWMIREDKRRKEVPNPKHYTKGDFIDGSDLNYLCEKDWIEADLEKISTLENEERIEFPWPEKWSESNLKDALSAIDYILPSKEESKKFDELFKVLTRCEIDLDSNKNFFIISKQKVACNIVQQYPQLADAFSCEVCISSQQ